jgi:hypothetical protein
MAKPEGEIVVASRLKHGERLFEFPSRIRVFASEPIRDAGRAMRDACFGRVGSCCDVA